MNMLNLNWNYKNHYPIRKILKKVFVHILKEDVQNLSGNKKYLHYSLKFDILFLSNVLIIKLFLIKEGREMDYQQVNDY